MRIIKSKKTGYQILCLSYEEWRMLIKNKFKEIKKATSNNNTIIDYIVCSITDFLIEKGCVKIKFQSKNGEYVIIKTYKEMEKEIKNELNNRWFYENKKA